MPTAQEVRIDTCNSEFDTVLAVYTGDSLGALTAIGVSDDACGAGSIVQFSSAAGTTYRIAVRGYGGSEGNFRLTIGAPAPTARRRQKTAAAADLPAVGEPGRRHGLPRHAPGRWRGLPDAPRGLFGSSRASRCRTCRAIAACSARSIDRFAPSPSPS